MTATETPPPSRPKERPPVAKRVVTRAEVDDPAPRPQASRQSRALLIVAVLGIVGTIGFGLAWAGARNDGGGSGSSTATAGATGDMLKAARSFSTALTNFDGATIDRDFDRITARSTGEFRSQADQFFSSDVRAQLKKAQASSRGEIRSAYVQTSKDDHGTVFVVVDQTIANNQSPQPQADTLRMELGLILKGDTWRVERVSVLTAPAGGATATQTSSSTPKTGN